MLLKDDQWETLPQQNISFTDKLTIYIFLFKAPSNQREAQGVVSIRGPLLILSQKIKYFLYLRTRI